MRTSELTGAALDWAVAMVEGKTRDILEPHPKMWFYNADTGKDENYWPSENWSQGGPIIERERMTVGPQGRGHYWAGICDVMDDDENGCTGPTPLIAAMRCYVACKLGDEVEIPEGLA